MILAITGATGNIGRPLVAELAAAGARVRAITRTPNTVDFPDGVEQVRSLAEALPGTSAVFLNSRALPQRNAEGLAKVVAQCNAAGVTKLVALSAINADDDLARQPSRFRGDRNREVEQAAVESGLQWVSLRPSVFASNFTGMWARQLRAGDVVAGPYAAASMAPIVDDDISAVAARALLTDELVGRKIPMTGPHALTNRELVDVIGTVLRRPLRYHELPPELVRQRFTGSGFSAEFADAYVAMLAASLDSPALVTHEVEKVLGRPPLAFAEWVARHRADFTRQADRDV
ncbi:NAD(P)H-binding protein [Mycobacterium asiaticum]|uniref:Nucleoside-diphosphate sugar epimerase n=1 Tax=Mycobacterium asiaticum TaxID=1790 RepID=A0A1A3NBL8_MYCAS|nr:NAD(P)H-binding protein [Mycobacterium asiaticum]OBK18464.1 nucleoside-diphosphate sugar epimerase [Mycobacterium asiaticum]